LFNLAVRYCAPETNGVKRLECLDGLRGVLALYVLLTHMAPFAVLPAWIVWLLSHGESAVDVFFVLSGMVIVRSLEHYEYRARPFLIARVARIFPVFLPVFVLAVLVQPVAIDFVRMPWIGPDSPAREIWSAGWPAAWVPELAAHLTMLHGVFPHAVLPNVWVSFLGASWSLSTEWQFYALVVLIGARLGRGEHGREWLVLLLLGLGLAGFAWQQVTPTEWWFSRAFLPNKAVFFALGAASAGLVEDPRRWPRFVIVLCFALIICLWQDNPLKVLAPLTWVTCLAAQSVQGRLGGSWCGLRQLGALLSGRSLRWLGAISYSLYLVNEPIQKLLGVTLAQLADGRSTMFTLLWVPSAVLVPVCAAWWLHRLIEMPALQRGRMLARAA
jgi:peptidoglycan/LPS O-acetylase OafA/YrhL